MIDYIRPTTSLITALLNNAEPLNIRRIVQSKTFNIRHASDNRVWYAYIASPESDKILAIAETYIIGTGERLFSVRPVTTQLTEEQEIALLEHTANGAIDKHTPAHTALTLNDLIEMLEGYTIETTLGRINEIHPRFIVGEILNSTASCVNSVTIWDSGVRIRLKSGANIDVKNAYVDPKEPYDVLFTVIVTEDENTSISRTELLDARQLRTILPSYVYYGVS